MGRGSLQLLQCYSFMAPGCVEEYIHLFAVYNHPTETASHVVNGCRKYQALCQLRHNGLIDVVASHISNHADSVRIIDDTCLSSGFFDAASDVFPTTSVRPSVSVIDDIRREVLPEEVTMAFDAFVNKRHRQTTK